MEEIDEIMSLAINGMCLIKKKKKMRERPRLQKISHWIFRQAKLTLNQFDPRSLKRKTSHNSTRREKIFLLLPFLIAIVHEQQISFSLAHTIPEKKIVKRV